MVKSPDSFHAYVGGEVRLSCSLDTDVGQSVTLDWILPGGRKASEVREMINLDT